MERQSTCSNLSYSGLSLRDPNNDARFKTYPVNSVAKTAPSHPSELRNLNSSIICSANISRQTLNRQPKTSVVSDNEDEFFQKLKSEIDRDLLSCSKENYKPNSTYPSVYSSRKKRPIIDEETQTIIKRFKKDAEDKSAVQTLHDTNMQSNLALNNNRKRTRDESTIAIPDDMQQEDMFTPNFLNMKFRNAPSKYVFQMSSKVQMNNILPGCTEEVKIIHTEYEEMVFYDMTYLTPPDNNSDEV